MNKKIYTVEENIKSIVFLLKDLNEKMEKIDRCLESIEGHFPKTENNETGNLDKDLPFPKF